MNTPDSHKAPLPRRVTVQIWGNDTDGFTGYVPRADITVTASSFDGVRIAALEAFRNRNHRVATDRKIDPTLNGWNCICGQENPPGRLDCSSCGSGRL